jgi:hypothetical protein
MQFQKGQSGNPAGRPRGSRNRASVLVHSLLEAEAENLAPDWRRWLSVTGSPSPDAQ